MRTHHLDRRAKGKPAKVKHQGILSTAAIEKALALRQAVRTTPSNCALSIADAAKTLTLSQRTIWRMIEAGTLKSVRVSERRRVVTAAEIARILAGGA